MASSATSSTRRRSYVSATAPPTKEQAISGINWTKLANPTCKEDPVRLYSWNGTATVVNPDPTSETISPKNR